ncbi:MarR family winged helix-turn-helix transcriptional regulator [Streptomyces sp. NPDC088725]|uniref:MarR family winged helix-turn-helix transcriptional regulator n=1 Tax=Streptomyces sp. NPDC088725 TaxID=3365873 RepID=UPI00380866E9
MNDFVVERARQIFQARRPAAPEPRPAPRARAVPRAKAPAAERMEMTETGEFIGALNTMYARLRRFDEWLRNEHQLNLTELHVLSAIPTTPQPAGRGAASRLAEEVELSPSGLTRLVDRLAERGLLTRARDPWDKRVTQLVLTDQGKAMRDLVLPQAAGEIRGTCGGHRALLGRLQRIADGSDLWSGDAGSPAEPAS